jgi:hypothetical protein
MTGDIVGTESREGGQVSAGYTPGKGQQRVKTGEIVGPSGERGSSRHRVQTGQRSAERQDLESASGPHRAKVSRVSSPESQHRVHTGQRSAQGQDWGQCGDRVERGGVKSALGRHWAQVGRRARPGSQHQVHTGQRSAEGQDLAVSTRSTPGKGHQWVKP